MPLPSPPCTEFSRREFLATGAAVAVACAPGGAVDAGTPHLASGVKVGEVTDSAAILWARLTAASSRTTGKRLTGRPKKDAAPTAEDVAKAEGACPGAAGRIRVRFGTKPDLADAKVTGWEAVAEKNDFVHQFALSGLPADATIHYAVETADPGDAGKPHGTLTGSFRTAPKPDAAADVTFAVVTCQMYADLDHADGFHIYPAIRKLDPRFVAFTGDNVYYDSEEPVARSPAAARYHWERMYSLPRHVELLRGVGTYWEKDDHDTLKNDSWPGQKVGDLSYEEGQRIFRQQVPMGESIYRTFRWGRFLQVWLTDGRDFRSPNSAKDGPEKTIWGKEQKAWLFRTAKASDATWKVLISPTPLVGPDRGNKGDNHANAAFRHEGDEVRAWVKEHAPNNFFVLCGDRHWQYHSVHPDTGLNEFSIGAASDSHAGGSPGEDKRYHRFHRVKGGFLSVAAGEKAVTFRHHDVHGAVVYQHTAKALS
jgi:alkaline phosphatase D